VKKNDWLSGIIITAGVALLSALPRLLRLEHFGFMTAVTLFAHTFLYGLCCWNIHAWLMSHNKLRKQNEKLFFNLAQIIVVAHIIYPYNYLFSTVTDRVLDYLAMPEDRKQSMLLLRGLVMSGLYYFILHHKRIVYQQQNSLLEIERLKQAHLEVNLSSLKEQLSPHFLFNTLNTLVTLTSEKPVKDYVNELANIYRHLLQYKQNDTSTLEQELNFTDSYAYILKSRFENAIIIDIAIPEQIRYARIPSLTLQLLIENAIKHNTATSYKPLYIQVFTEGAFLVINNNLRPRQSMIHSTGTGLNNISERYKLLFNKEIDIKKTDDQFIVKLPLII